MEPSYDYERDCASSQNLVLPKIAPAICKIEIVDIVVTIRPMSWKDPPKSRLDALVYLRWS